MSAVTREDLDDEVMTFGISFTDALDALRNGIADGREQDVYDALDQRRALRAATVVAQLTVGARVIAAPNTRPKHLAGQTGTVLELKPRSQKAIVRFDHRPSGERWNMNGSALIPVPTTA